MSPASQGSISPRNLEQYPEAGWPEVSGAMKYAVVIERGPTSYGAHVPDLPGCVAVAETKTEVLVLIREAIELYLEALEEDGGDDSDSAGV